MVEIRSLPKPRQRNEDGFSVPWLRAVGPRGNFGDAGAACQLQLIFSKPDCQSPDKYREETMPYFMTTSYKSIPDVDEDKYWDESWGSIVRNFIEPIDRGIKIDPKLFPSSGFLEQKTSVIPNLFSIQFWYCTDVIKQAIERLEPGRHYFHPYVLRDAPEGKEIAQLYIINIVDPVDAVDVKRSENLDIRINLSGKQITRVSTVYLSQNKREIALHEDLIKDRHLWLSPQAFGPGNAFISDELHDIIQQNDTSPSPLRFYQTK
ncbi:DUF1629 domain-containing protein [Labrenzia sp. DG1229]|uniref:imm11 family protein n=1 Tax=Labrenzia sp. DG1229 TaxID=681847 RepID=UPI00336A33B7